MSRGFPSMTALLGLLAIAGYQNRDKIAGMLGGLGKSTTGAAGESGLGGLLGHLKSGLGGAGAGGVLSGGLAEIVDRFKKSGHGETADSWVGTGPNKDVTPAQLERAIGPRGAGHLVKTNGIVAGRVARAAVTRASCRSR
jgi:uncharacterized protein YidB (DUF937 family)